MAKKIEIIKDENNPQSDQIIAQSIIEVSDSIKRFMDGPLKMDTIYYLIARKSGIGYTAVKQVMESAANLRRDYVK